MVKVIDALRDDDHRAALLPQPGFALRYGQMGGVGLLVQRHVPPVLVELPDPRWISREGLWRRQVLETFGFLVESNLCWRFILLQRTITIQIIQPKEWSPPFGRESQNGTHIKPTCVFNTCDNHFLHFSFCPLKVGTPLSALTPAPVMTAMCLALEKSSRNSSMSVKQNQHAELRRGNKRGFS